MGYSIDKLITQKLDLLDSAELMRNPVIKDGLVDFSSNDYLGIARNPDVQRKIGDAIAQSGGSGSTGSRLLTGHSQKIDQLEAQVAEFHKGASALLFNSGYDANLGLMTSLGMRNTTIVYDELIHASVHDGIKLAKAESVSFRHNDPAHLEQVLSGLNQPAIVAIESIYSMEGDAAPIEQILAVCEAHNSMLIVDEAHAVGMYGNRGEGRVVELGLEDRISVRLITFGKALGCHGAAVICSPQIRLLLINFSRSLIYTTALPDHSVLALKTVYDIMSEEGFNNLITRELFDVFKQSMKGVSGYDENCSNSQIQTIKLAGNGAVLSASKQLEVDGFDVRPIRFPSVPKGEERLRICLHEFNTKEQVLGLVKSLKSILK